jgi:hypothetical protein
MLALDKSAALLALRPAQITKTGASHFAFAGDFTLEVFKAKWADTSAAYTLLSNYNSSNPFANQRSWDITHTGSVLQAILSTNGSTNTVIQHTWTPTVGVEYDIAVDRSGSTVRLYIDGTMVASGTVAGGLWASTTPYLSLGQRSNGSGVVQVWTGQAKAVRITDAARYATNGSYTVPSLPLPAAA